jgi:hypothetical protein
VAHLKSPPPQPFDLAQACADARNEKTPPDGHQAALPALTVFDERHNGSSNRSERKQIVAEKRNRTEVR